MALEWQYASDSIPCGVWRSESTRQIVTITLISLSSAALTATLIPHGTVPGALLGHSAARKEVRTFTDARVINFFLFISSCDVPFGGYFPSNWPEKPWKRTRFSLSKHAHLSPIPRSPAITRGSLGNSGMFCK